MFVLLFYSDFYSAADLRKEAASRGVVVVEWALAKGEHQWDSRSSSAVDIGLFGGLDRLGPGGQ